MFLIFRINVLASFDFNCYYVIASFHAVTSKKIHDQKLFYLGVANLNNKQCQELLADEGAIELLLNRIWTTSHDELMQVLSL